MPRRIHLAVTAAATAALLGAMASPTGVRRPQQQHRPQAHEGRHRRRGARAPRGPAGHRRRERRRPGGRPTRLHGVRRLRRGAAQGRGLRADRPGVPVHLLRGELRAGPGKPEPPDVRRGTDFLRNAFDPGTPEGTATGPLVPWVWFIPPQPPNGDTSGCEAADCAGFPAGAIALMQRGTCGFAVKTLNAQAAGAAGVVIMNEGSPAGPAWST